MFQYYIIEQDQKIGPLTLADLHKLQISPRQLVWREGLDDWVVAKELPELAEILPIATASEPPPIPQRPIENERNWSPADNDELLDDFEYGRVEDIAGVNYRYALYVCGALLFIGVLMPELLRSDLMLVIFTGLAISCWYFFKRYFDALGDAATGKFVWWMIGAHSLYGITSLFVGNAAWLQQIFRSAAELLVCILISGIDACLARTGPYAEQLIFNVQLAFWGVLFSVIGIWISGIRIIYINRKYPRPLKRIALSAMFLTPTWMCLNLMDRLLQNNDTSLFGHAVLMLPFILLFIHFYRAEKEDLTP